jgi:hypothetical protein
MKLNMYRAIIAAGLMLLTGCMGSLSVPREPHAMVKLRLRIGEREETTPGFRVISIAKDGTTALVLDSGEHLSARPGERFDFLIGHDKPLLKSASHRKGVAQFELIVH